MLGYDVAGPLGRGANGVGADAVLLCVPDGEIARAAATIAPGRWSATARGRPGCDELAPHEAFSLHPLMTVTTGGADFAGAGAAIAGSTPRALALAAGLAEGLGMRAVEIADEDRAAYHAAASIASNFLVTLEAAAERIAAGVGCRARTARAARARDRRELGPAGPRTRSDRTGGARRRGDGRRASAPQSTRAPRSWCRCSMSL